MWTVDNGRWTMKSIDLSPAWVCDTAAGSDFYLDALYNYLMQRKKILLVLSLAFMLSACRLVSWEVTPTSTPTVTSSATRLPWPTQTETPTPELLPMCTPPLCAIGTNEVYYCSETCPNGCGTTCATYTPTPTAP
jgi:hypothetical protein